MRSLYLKAPADEKIAKELMVVTENNNEPIIKGYHGAAQIIMAKHYLNPISKLKTFKNGKAVLESAIENDKFNTELKFLRLTIQENSPFFLGYHSNIEQDRLFLKKNLLALKDAELRKIISAYLNKSNSENTSAGKK